MRALMRIPLSLVVLMRLVLLLQVVTAAAQEIVTYVPYENAQGQVVYLRDYREPALYSGNFADCLAGGSLVDIARFDVAYYMDNMTVIFRLAGTTELIDQETTVAITIAAYGQTRFSLQFAGCGVVAQGLCPLGHNETILANGVIPITQQEVSLIPAIALSIPDFEGEAILRIYSNTTNTEIACYSTTVSNGHSFSQPTTVGGTLGGFTFVAVIASFAAAAYYDNFKSTRDHYAHSVSVLVIFEVFQAIYLTGVFNVNWPSVLPAWWTNFAWACGMIYVRPMQNAISNFAGVKSPDDPYAVGTDAYKSVTQGLPSLADGFQWYGYLEKGGLPVPGFGTGFGATLADSGGLIVENAFLTGLIWFLILLLTIAFALTIFKVLVEGLAFCWLIDRKSLSYFRENWLTYIRLAALRTIFIAFFVLTFLSVFQFTVGGPAKVEAIAAITFSLVLVGMFGLAIYAYKYQDMHSQYAYETGPELVDMEQTYPYSGGNTGVELRKIFPWHGARREERPNLNRNEGNVWQRWKQRFAESPSTSRGQSVHGDVKFTHRFGWLTGRYRNKLWWFYLAWLAYQVVRACLLAGAVSSALTQIFCCLIVDIIAFLGLLITKPFQGQRLNTLVVYFLGISKIITTVLCVAFYEPFHVNRIVTAAIGIIIIVIQGILTVGLIAIIVTGFVTSYWSVTRNEAKELPSTQRTNFLNHVTLGHTPVSAQKENRISNRPKSKEVRSKSKEAKQKKILSLPPQLPRQDASDEPFFNISNIRRMSKIDDDDIDSDLRPGTAGGNSQADLMSNQRSMGKRASTYSVENTLSSVRSYNSLPFGARSIYRSSWNSRDFGEWGERPSHEHREYLDVPSSYSDNMLLPRVSGDGRTQLDEESPYSEQIDLLPLPQAYPYVNRSSRVISLVSGDNRSLGSYEVPSLVRPRTTTFDGSSPESPYRNTPRTTTLDIPLPENSHRLPLPPRVSFSTDAIQLGDTPPPPPPHKLPVSKSSRELPKRDDRRWDGQRAYQTDLPVPRYEGPPPRRYP